MYYKTVIDYNSNKNLAKSLSFSACGFMFDISIQYSSMIYISMYERRFTIM